ncbi:hypothetical protein PV387_08645 [Streptomyces sp. ME02-6987-2C]|uniref:hypothetical protein n=1 Tax=unclassified Streptomyces TaxID=2593676 RepID=UPI00069B7F03|nr:MULTISPECIES: hypothetical protein [unclassified Streptomyces]MDX3366097.1 hypothetical protein [Streptomyces sp. ME02-6987-2C]MDX3426398.1 hypothetical protein [Streptomyces sp. ME02-6985-2c]
MYLAAGNGCGGGIDFLGMFDDPIGEMIRMVAKLAVSGALEIFESNGDVKSNDVAASNVISGQIRWLVIYLSIGSLLFAAVKMALDRKADAGQTALKGVVRVVVVSAAASTVISTFAVLMDDYSGFLFGRALEELLAGIDCNDEIPNMLLLIIGALLIIAGIIHVILMYIRLGVMIMLMGTLPLAAAASVTDWGGTWWRKHLGWMIAWLLYKPTVALVMYSGAVMINSAGGDKVDTQIAGMGVLLLSAIALPALMRVIVPATEALGGDSVGSTTMGIASSIATGATGAVAAGGGKAMTGAMASGSASAGSSATGADGGGRASGAGGGTGSGGASTSGGGGGGHGGTGDNAPTPDQSGTGTTAAPVPAMMGQRLRRRAVGRPSEGEDSGGPSGSASGGSPQSGGGNGGPAGSRGGGPAASPSAVPGSTGGEPQGASGSSPQGDGGPSDHRSQAATGARDGGVSAAVFGAQMVARTAKGAVDIAQSAVEGADGAKGAGGH